MALLKTVVPKLFACAWLLQPFLWIPALATAQLRNGFGTADSEMLIPNPDSAQVEKNFSPVMLLPCIYLQDREAPSLPSVFLAPKHIEIGKEIQEQGFIQATGACYKIAYKTEAKCKREIDRTFHSALPHLLFTVTYFGLLHLCHKCSLKFSTLMQMLNQDRKVLVSQSKLQQKKKKKIINKRITKA